MRARIRALLLAWVLGIVVVSLVPSSGVSLWNLDKAGHFVAYAGLASLVCLSFDAAPVRLALSVIAVGLGAVLEFAQQFIPGRDMSSIDGLVNTLGVIVGLLLFRLTGPWLRRLVAKALQVSG